MLSKVPMIISSRWELFASATGGVVGVFETSAPNKLERFWRKVMNCALVGGGVGGFQTSALDELRSSPPGLIDCISAVVRAESPSVHEAVPVGSVCKAVLRHPRHWVIRASQDIAEVSVQRDWQSSGVCAILR